MLSWKDKCIEHDITFDELFVYANSLTQLVSISQALNCSALVYDSQALDQIKETFRSQFEILNKYLIKYIPGKPEMAWCTLPALLREYGIVVPHNLQNKLKEFVQFPKEVKPTSWMSSHNVLNPNSCEIFNPGHNIALTLSRNITLVELSEFVREVQTFEDRMLGNLDMFVFFKLSKSTMFDQYLRFQIQQVQQKIELQALYPADVTGTDSEHLKSSFAQSFSGQEEAKHGRELSVDIFVESLNNTEQIVLSVLKGDAKYVDIIANGALDLLKLDIDREFTIFEEYSKRLELSCRGLYVIHDMLELFQYSHHILNIHRVCKQYQLQGCIVDLKLIALKALAEELRSESCRMKLTPNEASTQLEEVNKALCLSEEVDKQCLEIFRAVQDSTAFYHFVRDKYLYGEAGVAKFNQQYQLITAHLQHEEYDEQVLNHLYAAFKLIIPFMDPHQTLKCLITNVFALDVRNGLKQLETVNVNINLIRLWFTKAEVGLNTNTNIIFSCWKSN